MSNKEHHIHEGSFDHKSPRPPIPGEEKKFIVFDWDSEHAGQMSLDDTKFTKPYSPTSKRTTQFPSAAASTSSGLDASSSTSAASTSRPAEGPGGQRSPPACLRWANSLQALLQDGDGVKLFRQYLHSEGKQHADALDFWFACEGLRKKQGTDKIMQIVKVIYRQYFVKSALPISDALRKEIGDIFKSSQCLEPPVTLYDKAQAQIEHLIITTTYPNFLKSDMYLQYLENTQTSTSSDSSSNDLSNLASGLEPLPTVPEDMELVMNTSTFISHTSGTLSTGYHTPNVGPPVRLTKDVLLMSQNRRAGDRSKSETFANMFVYRGSAGVHAAYNSYNPVSRQDSELHSLSSHSDVKTESDNMSMTDSSIDGRTSMRRTRRQAALNPESQLNKIVIPRTQRVDKVQCLPMDPLKFAAILIEKLEAVKKKQDVQELLDKKLKEADTLTSISNQNIREKLLLDDENDQSILDDHVSMVFPDTPGRSPGITTPHRNRHAQNSRRRKDGSIFSCDSGYVHDFPEGSEHKMGMAKSKSMPEYQDQDRLVRGGVGRRSSSSRHYPDLTQSSQSTLRKSQRGQKSGSTSAPQSTEEMTTVMFSFCDEQFPYRTKITGTQITLKQFKDYLPKKGNYRYFFKTVCEELGNQVIQEEISSDNDILPLWEGKIMAQVKAVD